MSNTSTKQNTRKRIEREARQHFILNAASDLIMETGIDATSMDDIAAASAYTRRTLYSYFISRDDILLQIHTENLKQRRGCQLEALTGSTDCESRLRIWAEALRDFWLAQPHVMRMEQYWDYRGIDQTKIDEDAFEQFVALNNKLASDLRDIFQGGNDDGSLRPDIQVDLCISLFIESLRRSLYRASSMGYAFADFDDEEYFENFLDLFIRGIRNEKGTPSA